MTDQEIVAGRGENAEASGTLGLNYYGLSDGKLQTVFSSADVGQGSGAVAWLTGDFTGSGHTEIAQLWDNGGTLGLNVYGMAGGTVQTVFESSDLGQGSGALAWLTGDFSDVGTTEIAQLWDDNGTLALTVYRYEHGTIVAPVGNDLGQGTGAVAWLTGDFFDRGSTQIVQLWDNDGTLGAVVYGVVNGTAETLFGSSDLGQGSGAVAWLAGNFSESDSTQIAQLWDNGGTLNAFIYDNYGNGNLGLNPFRGGNLGQGPGALAWLAGNFNGSGLTQIAQPWDS